MDYKEIEKELENIDDTNNCTVISASVAFDLPYKQVSDFYFLNGRKRNKGLLSEETDKMIKKLAKKEGFKVTKYYPHQEDIVAHVSGSYTNYKKSSTRHWITKDGDDFLCTSFGHMTAKNAETYLPKGNYILGVRGHVIGVKNGVVQDWTKGRKHYINRIWKVSKINKKVKTLTISEEFKTRKRFL